MVVFSVVETQVDEKNDIYIILKNSPEIVY